MEFGLAYTEMVSSKGLFYNDEKTKLLLNTENERIPVAAQIFGNDIEAMSFAARKLSRTAPKVVKNGDGSKLLLNLELAGNIIEAVVKNSQVPVTLKMRKGWDDNNIVAVELAKIAEEKGIKAITIHGRTREQFYTGEADWDIIKQVKQAVNIPVIRKWRYKNQRRCIKNV